MRYTGLESFTDDELHRMAHLGDNPLTHELAKRMRTPTTSKHAPSVKYMPAGVNPIPLAITEEED